MKKFVSAAALLTVGAWATSALAEERHVAALDKDDKKFVEEVATKNMGEIEVSRAVLQKTQNAEVKNLANQVISSHEQIGSQLDSLAQKNAITLPQKADDKATKMVNDIQKMSATKVDEKYVDHVIKNHEEVIKKFEKVSKDAKNPEVKAWAASTLPNLRTHLAEAQDVKDNLRAGGTQGTMQDSMDDATQKGQQEIQERMPDAAPDNY